jgi:membrane protein
VLVVALAYYGRGLYAKVDEHHLFLLAGSLAYSLVLCLVPLVLAIFALLGQVLAEPVLEGQVGRALQLAVPHPDQARFLEGLLLARARELVDLRGAFGALGLAGLLFAASGVFSTMRTILNTVFEVPGGRLELVGRAKDFALLLAVVCLFMVTLVLVPLADAVGQAEWLHQLLGRPLLTPLQAAAVHLTSFAAVALSLWALYQILPQGRIGGRVAAVGALCGAVLWKGAEQAFSAYLEYFGSVQRLYGAYALGAGALLWIYYSSAVFIAGAQISQLFRARRARLPVEVSP